MTRTEPSTSATVDPPSLWSATANVIRKDFLLEWRGRARLSATIFFGVMTLLLFSFAAGPDPVVLARNTAGYLWLAILLASVLSLGESFRVESENSALEGLLLTPVPPQAIFLGKALANTTLLVLLGVILVPVAIALYGPEVRGSLAHGALLMLLGCGAISAPGTLYAAIARHTRAQDVLLPLLLFPVLVPALVGAVKGTILILDGDPMGKIWTWTALLVVFNVVYWLLCLFMFGRVVQE